MQVKAKLGLALASLINCALAVLAVFFGLFATSPDMDDVTMRVGFYVVNFVALAAVAGAVLPWILALVGRDRTALFLAILPSMLGVSAVVAFLLLDSWINRTFS